MDEKTLYNGGSIGPYQILGELGQGGMGKVYKALDTRLQRTVALKVMHHSSLKKQSNIQRFRAEAKSIAQLDHPNIIRIFDMGEDQGIYFFAMEHIEGTTLRHIIDSKKYRRKEAISWLMQIAQAIHYAHQKGIIHRDIKPSNIMIDASGKAYIMDFGIAKVQGDDTITRTGELIGTPAFMAPEQLEANPKLIGKSSDIYSLGAVMYLLLTQRLPFQAPTTILLISKIIRGIFPPPRRINPKIPRELEKICLQAMAKKKSERYSSAHKLYINLKRYTQGKKVEGKAPTGKGAGKWVAAAAIFVVTLTLYGLWPGETPMDTREVDALQPIKQHIRAKKFDAAIATARKMLERDPGNMEIQGLLALATAEKQKSSTVLVANRQKQADKALEENSMRIEIAQQQEQKQRQITEQDNPENFLKEPGEEDPVALDPGEEVRQDSPEVEQRERQQPRHWQKLLQSDSDLPGIDEITYIHKGKKLLDMSSRFWRDLSHEKQWQYAQKYQQGYAEELGLTSPRGIIALNDKTALHMQLIPPGRFAMGENGEVKVVENPFWLACFETMQQQWYIAMESTPWGRTPVYNARRSRYPATHISPAKIRAFLGKIPLPLRLPNEAEWEYAYRSGCTGDFFWGDDKGKIKEYAWTKKSSRRPQPVGQKRANAWGLFDMAGNVYELCNAPNAPGQVLRGGYWDNSAAKFCNSTARIADNIPSYSNLYGFRLVLDFGKGDVISRPESLPRYAKPKIDEMFRGDSRHHGIYNGNPFGEKYFRTWSTNTPIRSSPCVVNHIAYIATAKALIAVKFAAEAQQLWSYPFTGDIDETAAKLYSSPAVADNIVYCGSQDGLYALDRERGTLLWKHSRGKAMHSSPTIAQGLVFIGCDDHNIYGVTASDGKWIRTFATDGPVLSSPAIADGVLYCGSNDHSIYAFDIAEEKRKWKFPTGGRVISSPTVANGVVYCGSEDTHLYALDATSGRLLWKFKTNGPIVSSPALTKNLIYIGSQDFSLYAIDANNGKEKWKLPTNSDIIASPIVTGGTIYVGSFDKKIHFAEAKAKRWDERLEPFASALASSLVIYENRLYGATIDGIVFAKTIPNDEPEEEEPDEEEFVEEEFIEEEF